MTSLVATTEAENATPAQTEAPAPALASPPSSVRRRIWPWLLGLLAWAVLAGGLVWLWHRPPREGAAIAALPAEIKALGQRLDGAEAATAGLKRQLAVLAEANAKLKRILAAGARAPASKNAALAHEVAELKTEVAALQAKAAALARQAKTPGSERMARVAAAAIALAAGEPLGVIAGAPPALARFATVPPPTEASLRLAFPQAASAALAASGGGRGKRGFWRSLWAKIAGLVTIRRGERVIFGNPAAGALADARLRLEAGDLAGAVATLGKLTPPALAAMAGWLGQAKALLAARAALAAMAAAS